MNQHVVDCLMMVLTETLQDDETRGACGQQQLGHDFVRAAQVNQLDIGKVQQRGSAIGAGESGLDSGANRRACGPGNQVAVRRGNGLAQEESDPDRLDHRVFASCDGMMICTWAPGK